MKIDRKLVIEMTGLLLLLLLLYVASSGPVIRYASFDPLPTVMVDSSSTPSSASRPPLAAQGYFSKVETSPGDFRSHRPDYAQEFYRPLVQAANTLHLATPLSAYLHMWGVFIMGTKNGHFFFLVLNRR
ncbi:MAG TPA: hypothetical protein VK961_01435 [Chthoniobacter sp.]|nr:hypothetical protein [Chthoniobacter sp.]